MYLLILRFIEVLGNGKVGFAIQYAYYSPGLWLISHEARVLLGRDCTMKIEMPCATPSSPLLIVDQ